MDKTQHDLCVYKANLAEQAERYEEMVEEMKNVAENSSEPLSVAERNLLSVAYKNVIGSKRSSLRLLISLLSKAESKGDSKQPAMINEMKETVHNEISAVCADILELLTKHILPKTVDTDYDAVVFYCKMQGDYHRYLAEYTDGEEREKHAQDSLVVYKKAADIANANLPTTSPIRLGLALNFSVFYYEILSNPKKACEIAKLAFDDAIADLDQVAESAYKDSTLIMQLLRDNLTLWTSDMEASKDDDLVAEDIEQS